MKNITLLALIAIVSITTNLHAQTILSIDDINISKAEFVDIYKKNNKDATHSQEDLDEYMDLFVNYKLKVMEALKLKLDTIPEFIKELKGYENQLAAPYLIDKDKTGALVDEAYDRMKTEVSASHILIGFNSKLGPRDTTEAYAKIISIREQIVSGEKTFEEMAVSFSTDPSAKTNKGQLGYFKSLQMVYPFESAAYNTKVGEISKPVKTRFGYHLIKVHDKRPTLGEVRVAHILIATNDKSGAKEMQVAEDRINELYKELGQKVDFEKLAIKYSDDKSSSKKGGELPQFGSGKMVAEFENEAFALKNDGDYSKPFKTSYGWHIIKRLERIPVGTKAEMIKDLEDRISKDTRAQITRKSFIKKLKSTYAFKEKKKALTGIYSMVDESIFSGSWKLDPKFAAAASKKKLFTINGKAYTQNNFLKYLRASQGRSSQTDIKEYVNKRYSTYVDSELMNYERSQLESKYPKFKSLMREYRDGILLFNLTEEKIWGKAAKDSVGLKNYYSNHKEDFKYNERVKATIYNCKNMEIAEMVKKEVESGKTSKELNEMFNKESKLNVIIKSGTFEKEDEDVFKNLDFVTGVTKIEAMDNQFVFVNITEVMPEGIRAYEDSKGLVTADYQKYLELEWIKELRASHTIKVDKDVLYSVK